MPLVRPRADRALLLATTALAVTEPVLAGLAVDLPGRLLLAVLYALLVPGVPIVLLLRLPDARLAVALTTAVSIATLLAASTSLLVLGRWTEPRVTWLVTAVSVVFTLPALRRTRGHRAEPAALPPFVAWLSAAAPRILRLVVLGAAVEVWYYAARTTDLDRMGASGLISVVGAGYWVAIVAVAAVVAWQLRSDRPDPVVLVASYLAVVVMLFGYANVADSAPGFPTAWVHVGFIDYISRQHAPALGFDARFSWPGFFGAGAVLVHLGGLPDAAPLIRWAPVVYNALALPAVLVIGRCLSGSSRGAWLGAFLYTSFNWFSQDYLSPQATVLLLYLATVATLLVASDVVAVLDGPLLSRVVRQALRGPLRPPWLSAGRALGLELVLLLLGGAAVVSHQLTPVALIGVLFAFAVTGATRYRRLWLLVALAFLGWFSYGAEDFWRGHLGVVFGDIGKLGSTLGSSVGQRLQGDAVHGRMQQLRLLWSAGSLGLALIGLWLRRRDGRIAVFGALLLGPFGLLAVQSYGGEVALRSFVYAQPATAPLAAVAVLAALDRLNRSRRWREPVAVGALTVGLVAGWGVLTATRGANEGFERVTAQQVRVTRVLAAAMPKGSRIGLLADAGPLGLTRLTDYEPVSVSPALCPTDLVTCIRRARPDYLYVTSTMDVLGQLQFGEPPGWTDRVVADLVRLRLYRRLASDSGVMVLGRVEPAS